MRIGKLLTLGLLICILLGACGMEGNTTATSLPTSPMIFEVSFQSLMRRDPETTLELGLSQVYNTPTDQLTNISDEYIRQTQTLESDILTQLRSYDRSSLTSEQQLSYDIYAWYLGDRVNGQAFMYDDYPINPTVFSEHLSLLQWFTDLRPLNNLQDAQDYITCLTQVNGKFDQLIDNLERREENGVMLPTFLVNWILSDLTSIANSRSSLTPYYTAFESKVNMLADITEAEKQSLLKNAEDAITTSVIPAYQALCNILHTSKVLAPTMRVYGNSQMAKRIILMPCVTTPAPICRPIKSMKWACKR
jgi:uncharacterized protein (DUF885 family)